MSLINIGLAVEVVKWCDELCLGWKLVNECRDHLDKVKAQSYIDKYEMKLCDPTLERIFQMRVSTKIIFYRSVKISKFKINLT